MITNWKNNKLPMDININEDEGNMDQIVNHANSYLDNIWYDSNSDTLISIPNYLYQKLVQISISKKQPIFKTIESVI